MDNTEEQKNEINEEKIPNGKINPVVSSGGFNNFSDRGNKMGVKRNFKSRSFGEKVKPEFDNKIIDIRRVTRVVAGGRRFSFSVSLVIGDGKGSVGFGIGKAGDTASAIEKALRQAKKNIFKVPLTKEMSIPHEVLAKFCSSRVMLMPNRGRGIVAGSSVRDIINLAKIKNVTSKIFSGSKNKLNNAKAAINALRKIKKTK